jgi:cellulose synthase/poly-beta-1,6-N-acetylglucosamine synthase-like glycosyltransferase
VESITELLKQRKRWMAGAVKLPFYIQCVFLLQVLVFTAAIAFLWIDPFVFLLIFLAKSGIDTAYLLWMLHRLREIPLIKYILLYEAYIALFSPVLLIYYFMSGKVEWKGRKYENK